jgi:hypothetical protein
MMALLAAAINYREALAPIWRGDDWINRLGCQRSIDKLANSPSPVHNA